MTPPSDVASWDAAKFATLSTLHVKTLSSAQLAAITGAQLSTLPQNRMAAFTPAQVGLMMIGRSPLSCGLGLNVGLRVTVRVRVRARVDPNIHPSPPSRGDVVTLTLTPTAGNVHCEKAAARRPGNLERCLSRRASRRVWLKRSTAEARAELVTCASVFTGNVRRRAAICPFPRWPFQTTRQTDTRVYLYTLPPTLTLALTLTSRFGSCLARGQVAELTPDALRNLPATHLAMLTKEAIAALTGNDHLPYCGVGMLGVHWDGSLQSGGKKSAASRVGPRAHGT